jgi:hypothetical protein
MTIRFAWSSYTEPWAVTVENVRIGGEADSRCLDAARRRLRLDLVTEWESATFDVTASTAETAPSDVTAVSAFAVLSSRRSNTRIPFRLEPVGPTRDRFSGTIALQRAALAGAAEMAVDVGGRIDGRDRLVGVTEPWHVIVDAADAPRPPGRPPFDTAWIDFRAATAPSAAKQQPEAYAVMDLTGPKPTLLLNEAIDGLKTLLLALTARHERRRLREMLGTSIARQAIATLIRAAATEVVPLDPDESQPQDPQSGLFTQVCEAVAGEMTTVASVSDLYERLVNAARGAPMQYAELWAEIDAAVDRLTGHSSAVASVVAEVKYV